MNKFAFYDSIFGKLKIGYCDKRITCIMRAEALDCENQPCALTDNAFRQIQEYLGGQRRTFDLPVNAEGTPFQKKVWSALCAIPYGETRSYRQIAEYIGTPKAYRAVGAANRNNPIWIIIPCHRVIGSNGAPTGYAGGIAMKEYLLKLEKTH